MPLDCREYQPLTSETGANDDADICDDEDDDDDDDVFTQPSKLVGVGCERYSLHVADQPV